MQSKSLNERNRGIDLLKIVLMFMICMIHILGKSKIVSNSIFGVEKKLYDYIYIFCFCAVDAFALISGYIQNSNYTFNLVKPLKLWFQVVFYTVAINFSSYLLELIATGNITFNIKDVFISVFPVTSNTYWYFSSYFPLCILAPFINKIFKDITTEKSKKSLLFVAIFMTLFFLNSRNTIYAWFNDGFSFFWLLVLYIVGILMKKSKVFEKTDIKVLAVSLLVLIAITLFLQNIGIKGIVNYVSPTIVLSSIVLVLIFSKLNLKNQKITKISSLSFGIYLFHANDFVFSNFILNKFEFICNFGFVYGLFSSVFISVLFCVLGIGMDYARKLIFKKLKINVLCDNLSAFLLSVFNL